jgi:hypothetical protein
MRDLKAIELSMQTSKAQSNSIRPGALGSAALGKIDVPNEEVDRVTTRSKVITVAEHLSIYNRSNFATFKECLRAEFPILLHALGDNLFELFTIDYLQYYPSLSHTLNILAEGFHEYLAETHPDIENRRGPKERWPDFIIDLATMERAFSEVFDGPGVEGQQILDADQSIQTTDRFMETRFLPVVCLKLFAFRYPVSRYFTAVRNNENPTFPEPAETFLAMTRRDYVVCIHELTRFQYDVLSALVAGQTLSQVVSLVAKASDRSHQSLTSMAFAWINDWAEKGFFAGIER